MDLGFLLHKNPKKDHRFSLNFGEAYIFFPIVSEDECMMALLVDIDPIDLVRKESGQGESFSLAQYVNDRPYVASSFLSVAIAKTLRSAMIGSCSERPELLKTPIPLEACVGVFPSVSKDGKELLLRLFQPLGYEVLVKEILLDIKNPQWGHSHYFQVTLKKTCFLKDLLSHLYVLIPVLDNSKHYWVSNDEVDKLLRAGEGWLNEHPAKDLIVSRYLKKQRSLTHQALDRLLEQAGHHEEAPEEQEEKKTLQNQRMQAVVDVLKKNQVQRVADLGCGDGDLLQILLHDLNFEQVLGMDVSYREVERAKRRLRWDTLPKHQKDRITLIQGSLNYTDKRLLGYDAVTLVEVIEHFDAERLSALEYVVFGYTAPRVVVVTSPNAEYNCKFDTLPCDHFRHTDHRFEWSRKEFQDWAEQIGNKYGYTASFLPIGPADEKVGSPTQMGLFIKNGEGKA